MSVSSWNKYSHLSNEEITEIKKSEESGSKKRPPAQIKILSRKEKVETTTKGKSPPGSDQPKKNVRSWINTVNPWSTTWIKKVCENTDTKRAKAHLNTFVHESRRPEVTNKLVEQIRDMTMAETHIVLRELQHKPRYIHQSYNKNTLDVNASILTDDGKILSTKALIDSGCMGSSIEASFVEQHHIPVHQLPRKIPVYNADGTPNSRGAISSFVMVELTIDDHIEQITLAITDLGTHKIYLGYDWLKTHNPIINWKTKEITFTCSNDHTPHLIDDDDEDETPECTRSWKGGDRIFQIDALEYLRATQPQRLAMDLAIEADKIKHTKTFEEVVPEVYHDLKKDVFDKDIFEELPP